MTKIVMVISCFEKADEMYKFYQSIEESDLTCIPRIIVINTDPENGLTGEQNIEIAQHFKRQGDRVFISHRNLYMSSYRYVIQKYATGYDFMIGSEADVWFEVPFRFGDSLKYIQRHSEIATITCLARYQTDKQNEYQFKDISGWKRIGQYLEPLRSVPWHMCLTRISYMLGFFKMGYELIDTPFTRYCQKIIQRKTLVLDCRDYFVHFDYHATIQKYPHYADLCGIQYYDIQHRPVNDSDIEEI